MTLPGVGIALWVGEVGRPRCPVLTEATLSWSIPTGLRFMSFILFLIQKQTSCQHCASIQRTTRLIVSLKHNKKHWSDLNSATSASYYSAWKIGPTIKANKLSVGSKEKQFPALKQRFIIILCKTAHLIWGSIYANGSIANLRRSKPSQQKKLIYLGLRGFTILQTWRKSRLGFNNKYKFP